MANVERLFLQRTGWLRSEPLVLVSDLTRRETGTYETILRAIVVGGKHTREAIGEAAVIPSTALSHYLSRLLDLQLVERRIPAIVPLDKRKTSKGSRYFLRDAYLRFYYRFVDPNLHLIEQGLSRRLWASMGDNFRAFVAETFEDLSRAWVLAQAQAGTLPFEPEVVGAHWAPDAQVDVVAIDWKSKRILLGEATWGEGKVGRDVIRELIDKTPKVVPQGGKGWQTQYAFFARERFTDAARDEAGKHGSLLTTLTEMEREIG
ncbi:MAG: ATP-binding protein [Chloroflexi bacterium]|nr:ATP-binding protein [Chloroflexota bacterium]